MKNVVFCTDIIAKSSRHASGNKIHSCGLWKHRIRKWPVSHCTKASEGKDRKKCKPNISYGS